MLYHAARVALTDAQSAQKGQYWKHLYCLICTAFSLEAFLNHVGSKKLSCWDTIERRLSPRDKTTLLLELSDSRPEWGREPFQSFGELMDFRNDLAHGKTETLSTGQKGTAEIQVGGMRLPATHWEKACDSAERISALHKRAQEFMKDVSIRVLGSFEESALWSAS